MSTTTSSSSAITIVSGLPRSGTSVMMQMIYAGGIPALTDAMRAADLDNPRGYFEFEPVKQTARDKSWLASAAGKVVKMVHLLLLDLPLDQGFQYRVVMMMRDPDEVIASQAKMLQRLRRNTPVMDPSRLKAMYAQQMSRVQRHLEDHPETFTVLKMSYNELVQDAKMGAERVNRFLGGTLEELAMIAAVDQSLYRNRIA